MKDNYELKNPRPNPYAERMKNGYTIIIERDSEENLDAEKKNTENSQQFQAQTQSAV